MATETPIKTTFRKQFASDFMNRFQNDSESFYFLFYGRVHPWDDDSEPAPTVDTFGSPSDGWNNMIGTQLIQEDDLSLIIPRYNWTSGTVYSQYEDDVDLFNESCPSKFYIMNSNFRIYKCIYNNKGGQSTDEPISTTTNIFQTPDGYRWKFLYQIPEDLKKFVTSEYIPVETLTAVSYSNERALQFDVQQAATDGSINQINVTQQGTHWPHTVVATHYVGDNEYTPNRFEIQQNVVVASANIGDVDIALNMKNILTYAGAVQEIAGYSLYIYSGSGAGQYMEIESATAFAGGDELGYALVTLKEPLTRPLSVASDDISRFEILPTIKVLGNGSSAVAIPQMKETAEGSAQYVIDSVIMVNGGQDYSVVRATADRPDPGDQADINLPEKEYLQTLLKVHVSPPGGHGSNPEVEMGARDVMINVKTTGDVGGAISAVNDFRQFGVITNPVLWKGELAGDLAGQEQEERIRLRVIKPEQIEIHFNLTGNAGDNYYPILPIDEQHDHQDDSHSGGPLYDYIIGDEVVQEGTGAKGIVLNWIPPVNVDIDPTTPAGEELVGRLFLEVTDGTFVKGDSPYGPGEPYVIGISSTTNGYPNYNAYHSSGTPLLVLEYTDETFDVGSIVMGTTSYSTAKIVEWTVDEGGRSGFLYLSNINGAFIIPRIDLETGDILDGERITQFVNVNKHTGIFDISNVASDGLHLEMNSGIIGSDTTELTIPIQSYKQTYTVYIKPQGDSSVIVSGDYPKDSKVSIKREGIVIGTAYVVDFLVDEGGETATLELTTVKDFDGEFKAEDLIHFGDTTTVVRKDTTLFSGTKAMVDYPELKPDSGEMLYIQNILPVKRNPERSEEMKLILRF